MIRPAAVLLAALALGGCDLDFGTSGGSGGFAPRVVSSSPDGGVALAEGGAVEFRVEVEDEDSLDLTWSWFLDGGLEDSGATSTGAFLAAWRFEYDPALAGDDVLVEFEATDGERATDLSWVVSLD